MNERLVGERDAVGGVLDGACGTDHEMVRSSIGVVTVTGAAKRGGVEGEEFGEEWEVFCLVGEATDELKCSGVDLVQERGGPLLVGGCDGRIRVVVDVSRKEVGKGGLGTRAKEGALCLWVEKAGGQEIGVAVEAGGGFTKELLGEGNIADRVTKDSDSIDEFGIGVSVVS